MGVVTVDGFSDSGTCDYCRKQSREGVACTFGDGSFSGFLCKTDFWRFVRLRIDGRGRDAKPLGSLAAEPAANGR